jgi:tetratricopeptide (TPR) repeat protein
MRKDAKILFDAAAPPARGRGDFVACAEASESQDASALANQATTVDKAFQAADQHHRASRPHEAEAICKKILAQAPNHPDALHLLGILQAQAGNLDVAEDLIGQAVHVRPEFAEAWANLGCVLVNHRKYDEAILVYSRLIQLRPTDGGPHYALGILWSELGRLDEAVGAFSRATQLQPDPADAHMRLGTLLRTLGQSDDAIAAFTKAVALRPDWADAHNNLANVLRDKGLFDEAIAEYIQATDLKGDDAVTHFNLGNALFQMDRFGEALPAYEQALWLKADYFEAHNMMGLALTSLRRFEEAERAHHQALTLRPDDASAYEALGSALLYKLDARGAEASFRKSLALSPDSGTAWNGLGMALMALGQFEQASECYRRALAICPDRASFHRNLISIGALSADQMEMERLTELLNKPALPLGEHIDAAFGLGKLLDDADRFDEAFGYFVQGNALMKQRPAGTDEVFDADKLHRMVDRMIQRFTPEFLAKHRWGEASELPVFIVGMPRSGTTLVEQVAASHSSVFGAGELSDIGRMAAELSSEEKQFGERVWNLERIARGSRKHLQHLQSRSGPALRVIDKMPGNVFHLGLIAAFFPTARVVFCRRDARDTCLSCYFQRFANSGHRYTYDLADCGRQWLETDRLINHWIKVLPLKMLEMHYEEMVADQEGQSRRLIEFLGLPWDPACLEFHKTQRPVMTASVWQVRQPIYTRSVGRWQHYQRHLGPLQDVLAGRSANPPGLARSLWELEGLFPEKSMKPDLQPTSAVIAASKLSDNLLRGAPPYDREKK